MDDSMNSVFQVVDLCKILASHGKVRFKVLGKLEPFRQVSRNVLSSERSIGLFLYVHISLEPERTRRGEAAPHFGNNSWASWMAPRHFGPIRSLD